MATELKEIKDLLGSPEQLAQLIEPLIKKWIASKKTKSVLSTTTKVVVNDEESDEESKKEVRAFCYF